MKINGSQLLIECLIEQGVDTVFGYPGGAVLNIYDALYKNQDRIKHILTSHEQGASHAADGYARSTGKVGVVIATSGPGATNLVTGIATAYMDSVPLIAITGNVTNNLLGKDSFQEVDITGITIPITKHNYIVKSVDDLAQTIKDAFRIATSGRPGPVLIDIPKDVTAAMVEYKPEKIVKDKISYKIDSNDLNEVIELINNSSKPFIYAGGGVIKSSASKELFDFATKANIPVATSLMGIGAFPQSNPLSLGLIGMHGTIKSNKAMVNCDLLLVLGARFSDRVLSNKKHFAEDAKIVHIDIDQAEFGKNIKPYLSIRSDIKFFIDTIINKVNENNHSEWLKEINSFDVPFNNEHNELLRPKFMMEEIYKQTNGKAIITTEVGQHQLWAAQYYTYDYPNKLITSGGLGTMGFGTGAAIGAMVGNPDSIVVHVAGDGSFRMNLNELATIEYYNLPIVIVVVNNRTLGMVRQWQTAFYEKRYSQTDLKDRKPDFNMLADSFGISNYKSTTKEEFSTALNKALSSRKPALINTYIDIDEKVLPMVAPGKPIDDIMIK